MVCGNPVKVMLVVVHCAAPPPSKVWVLPPGSEQAIGVPPSIVNVTVPVGTLGDVGVTLAVKVTAEPWSLGLPLDATVVVLGAPTVTVNVRSMKSTALFAVPPLSWTFTVMVAVPP
jgi:hypothetical protein